MELRTMIVGNRYRPIAAQEAYYALKTGDELTLHREPDNKYDSRAVAVYTNDGTHIGYIPRAVNRDLAAALDENRSFLAEFDAEIDRIFITEIE